MDRARTAGVTRIYLPAIDSETHEDLLGLEAACPGICFAMMGLHPCSVKDNFQQELDEVSRRLAARPFTAVGEIGLDHYWDKTHAEQQAAAFRQQMEWALDYRLPVVIHTRNAMQETIDQVKPFAARGLRGIFHCFSGSYESAAQITAMGFFLGIGGVVTYPKAGLGEAGGQGLAGRRAGGATGTQADTTGGQTAQAALQKTSQVTNPPTSGGPPPQPSSSCTPPA